MKVLICIDDTDNLESRGTGHLAEILAGQIEERGWGRCSGITRHQLCVHPDIPYTSHNSSMCFETCLNNSSLTELIDFASEFLLKESAEGSDPGLCIVAIDNVQETDLLVKFGCQAKIEVLTKQEAYDLAQKLGIHLSEHGGTGQGVIGALAGVGLRFTGNDGRFKGKIRLKADNDQITVRDILAQSRVELVKSLEGTILEDDDVVILGDKVKAVMLEGKCVMLVYSPEGCQKEWHTCTKQQLRKF
ncbi:hypothetical protein [Phosphitispora sp. TUW77]|uniref:hypothetical protein n=1 Tax=Phosphitispora sp. TUW77 TaxID=3152361 RepID=UPI003AB2E608